ncbi:MAG TPA: hypothetical protein VEQ15_08595 [Myxococcales bacterium]|nr:hypothetical protein [Myxococcales bacterium]
MPDEVDELILKMQHLEAQARAQREAQALEGRGKSLKSRAQQVAWAAQAELSAAEAQQRAGEEKLQRARDPGLKPIAAADLLEEGRRLTEDARSRVIKARAKLNFALDQMDQAERREYEALRADARAEAHRQMAEDPLFKGTPPASTPTPSPTSTPTSTPTPSATSTPTAPPRKTLGRRRPKGS